MARAITVSELAKLRSDGQFTRPRLLIDVPVAVFKARINQTFTTLNSVAQITYDGVTLGAYTDVVAGMTLYIGSSEAAYDIGITRIRKTPTAAILYINPESEIDFANDLYLTVVDEYGLWCKRINETDGKADYDTTYSDQHATLDPVPVMGPDQVLWYNSATETASRSASDSYCLGGTISSYAWLAPGASSTTGLNTATPTMTYSSVGRKLISCTVTSNGAKTTTGRRNIYVDDGTLSTENFTLDDLGGDYESGGWNMRVTLYDDALISQVRERAKVILYGRDWYNGTEESYGPVDGCENVIFIGWISEENIHYSPNVGTVEFDVNGPAWWMGRMLSQPLDLEDSQFADGSASGWAEFGDLTVDKALWHLLHWRSTADTVLDCVLTSDTRQAGYFSSPIDGLYDQLLTIAQQIFARPVCDRYGRLFVEIDQQLVPLADRASFSTIMAVTEADWTSEVEIWRRDTTDAALVEIVGAEFDDGDEALYGGRSPGDTYADYGEYIQQDEVLVGSRDQTLQLAGLYAGKLGNEYPEVSWEFLQNNRLVDIAPRQYVTMTLVAADTERALVWSAKKLIPRTVRLPYDHSTGMMTCEVRAEAETFEQNSVEFDIPSETEPPITPPENPPDPPPPPPEVPPEPPTPSDADAIVSVIADVRTSADFDQASPAWTTEL